MRNSSLRVWVSALLFSCTMPVLAQATKHGMTLDDYEKLVRVGSPRLSPEGHWIAYTLSHVDTAVDTWLADADGHAHIGGPGRQGTGQAGREQQSHRKNGLGLHLDVS